MQWVEGRCLSYGGSMAYLLWVDLLRGLLGVRAEAPPLEVRDAVRDGVWRLCLERFYDVYPYLGRLLSLPMAEKAEEVVRHLEGESLKIGVFNGIRLLVGEAARHQGPLVVVCEDLHWADPTSLELLGQLLALTDQVPLLFLCVFRPEMEHGCWEIKERAARVYPHRHSDLWLDALSAEESEALVGHLLRVEELPPRLRERVLEHAEGNPFYVEEIVRALIEEGAIAYDEGTGRWGATREVSDIPIPSTLHGVLMSRMDRLEGETRHVLQLASVIGRVFLYRVLAEIALEKRELDAHLVALQRRQLIRERARVPELEYIFKHELTREAAYNGLLRRERRAYHRQVAEALERLFPDRVEEQLGLLGHHWERAGEGQQAAAYLRRAGERAAAEYANQEAVEYLSRALALTAEGDLEGRCDLLLARERVYDLLAKRDVQGDDLAALEEMVEALDSDRRRMEAALRQASYALGGDLARAVATAQRAIRLAQAYGDVEGEARGYLTWGQALFRQEGPLAALPLFEKALALDLGTSLRQVGSYSQVAAVLDWAQRWDLKARRAYFEQALRLHRERRDRRGEAWALDYIGLSFRYVGDYGRARRFLEQGLGIFGEIGDWGSERHARFHLAWLYIIQGGYARARTFLEENLRSCREVGQRGWLEAYSLSYLALPCHYMGDDEAARQYAQQAVLLVQELGDRSGELDLVAGWVGFRQGYASVVLGCALEGLGQPAEAANAYRRGLGQLAEDVGVRRQEVGQLVGQCAAVLQRAGQSADLPVLHQRGALGVVTHQGIQYLMECLAGLARVSLAQGDQEGALAWVEELWGHLETPNLDFVPEPFPVYLTCYRVFRAAGDPRAEEVLQAAHSVLQERAARIEEDEMRRTFLEVPFHREIAEEWGKRGESRLGGPSLGN